MREQSFKAYLKKKELTDKTIHTYNKMAGLFLKWLEKEHIKETEVRYQDVLAYMNYCRKRSVRQVTIGNYIGVIKQYYHYLQTERNPVEAIELQGIKRKSFYHLFEAKDLDKLYNSQEGEGMVNKRNKVMLGLLVYQGLTTNELSRLEISHIHIREGKIEIPGSKKSNSRILQLKPIQIMDLYEYLLQTRKELLKQSGQQTERLLVSHKGGMNLSNYLQLMLKKLRAQHKKLANAKQLRASVITKWLKQYNLREVQYMAGHRYISSTENYLQNDMEGLVEEVNKYHPL
jgi:site-specific recombinase XerD